MFKFLFLSFYTNILLKIFQSFGSQTNDISHFIDEKIKFKKINQKRMRYLVILVKFFDKTTF